MTDTRKLWREAPPYFETLEIGDQMESAGRTVTEVDIVSFAALTGDWHPQHADAHWAAENGFGGRIAHGMLVISYSLGLLPIDPRVVIALRSMDRAVLKRPVAIGDSIRARARVVDKRPLSGEAGLVTLGIRIVNQDDELVARIEMTVIWRREHLGSESNGAGPGDGDRAARPDPGEDELSPIQDGRLLA
jgi:3-hydroxybutyryl-CoA dehydratase